MKVKTKKTTSNSCVLKVAHLHATSKNYDDAISKFEQAGGVALEDKLLRYSAREYFFKAGLCQLARIKNLEGDVELAKESIERYMEQDVQFPGTPECKMLEGIVKALEAKELKQFQLALKEYDNLKKLDNWCTQICLEIKGKFDELKKQNEDLT